MNLKANVIQTYLIPAKETPEKSYIDQSELEEFSLADPTAQQQAIDGSSDREKKFKNSNHSKHMRKAQPRAFSYMDSLTKPEKTEVRYGKAIGHLHLVHHIQYFPKTFRGTLVRVATTIHFNNQTMLVFDKSSNNALNVATYINSINRTQTTGKFVFYLPTGELQFQNHCHVLSMVSRATDDLIRLSEKSVTVHLPRILLLFSQIEYEEYLHLPDLPDRSFAVFPEMMKVLQNIHQLALEAEKNALVPNESLLSSEILQPLPFKEAVKPSGTLDPRRRIVSQVFIQETEEEIKEILSIERVGNLSFVLAKARFEHQKSTPCALVSLIEVSSDTPKFLENTEALGEYFLLLSEEKCYYRNILPMYLECDLRGSLMKIEEKKRFFQAFSKHGNLQLFLKSTPPHNSRFFLSLLLQLTRTLLYYYEVHKIVHLDLSLQLMHVLRSMQIQLGYVGKSFLLAEKFREVGYKHDYAEYQKNFALPSDYTFVAPEVFQRKSELITDKTAVYYIANHIETLFFQRDRGVPKLSESDILLRNQEQGRFTLNYLPKEITEAAPKVIALPLANFVRLCLHPQQQKRPTLRQLENVLSDCLLAMDLLYQ